MPQSHFYFRDSLPTWTLLFGIGLGLIAIYLTTQKLILRQRGVSVEAKLVSIQKAPNGLRAHLAPVGIEFTDAMGALRQATLNDLQIDQWGIGDLIPIRYDREDPSRCEVEESWSRWFIPIFVGVVSGFFLLVSVISLFFAPMLIGAVLLGMFGLLCLFAGTSGVYRTAVSGKILRKVVSYTEEYFYHESKRLNADGTTSVLPVRQYFARVHFEDEKGQRQRVVIECPPELTEKPVGTEFEIQYDPRAVATAEMTTPTSAGCFQSGLLIFAGLFTLFFAFLLRSRA